MRLCANELLKCFRQTKLLGVLGICLALIAIAAHSAQGGQGGQHVTGADLITEWTWGILSGLVIPVILAMLCTDLVSGEVTAGTAKLLLIRPVPRWAIWLSKWVAGVLTAWLVLGFLAAGTYVLIGALHGFGSWDAPAYLDSTPLGESVGRYTLQAYGLQLLNVTAMVTFMLALSTFVDHVALAFGITMAVDIGTMLLLVMGHAMNWEKFLFSVQWWLPQQLTGNFPVPCSLAISLAVAIGWTLLFFAAGVTRFQSRDFTS